MGPLREPAGRVRCPHRAIAWFGARPGAVRTPRLTTVTGRPFQLGAAALLLFAFAAAATAQEILAPPPPEYFAKPPVFGPTATNLPGMATNEVTIPLAPKPLLELGPVVVRPHILYRFSYGDGIPAAPGEQVLTAINELSPGLLLQLGDHWMLDYTPTLRFYSSDHFRDTTDHAVLFSGTAPYRDWVFGLSQTFATSSQPLAETASQTDEETFVTALHAAYHMSSAMSLELGGNQNFRFFTQSVTNQSLVDSREWSTLDWLNYQFSPTFGAAIGAGFGYVDVSAGSDMTYEQLQGRVNLRAGDKLGFVLSGGADYRQFIDSDAPNLLNPIYGLSVVYQLTETTTLSANGTRVVSAAYFQDQVTETTSIGGGLRQRFFKKLYLDLTGGYTMTTYKATIRNPVSIVNVNREDDYSFVNVRLSVALLKRGTVAVFYQASENTSNASGFAYTSNQGGFELGYRF